MSDALNDIVREENAIKEETLAYCVELVTADINGLTLERKRKDKDKWEISPRGKFNFIKYDYRIK